MTTKNFSVKNGLTVGLANIDAATGNILTSGNISATGNVNAGALSVSGVSTLGPVGNVKITGGSAGQVISTDGSGNLSFTTVSTSALSNGTSNLAVLNNGNITMSSAGNANVVVVTGSGANISGTLSASGNANVGNIGATNGVFTYVTGDGNALSNITGGNVTGQVGNALIAGTVYTNAQPNITSTGTLASLSVSGNANVGNVGANNAVFTGTGSFGGNVDMATYWINNVGYPVLNGDAATKSYVDTMISSGISYHEPVAAATTTTLATATGGTVTYNNGTAGVGANLTTTGTFNLIDTANVQTVGTRILVKNEANAAWNGIYEYTSATVITRTADADQYGPDSTEQLSINDYFFVQSGNVNKGSAYVVSAPAGTITFGTSNITFAQFSTSQVYSAGTGLTLDGTTFNVNNSQTQVTAVGTLASLSVSGNANVGNIGATFGVFTNVSGNGSTLSSITGANVTGAVSYATTANSVAGANVSGEVAFAATANAVAGANVSGAVGLATYATTANAVAGANVSGQVSNALVAGTVYTAAQGNITSVGTLTSVSVSGNANIGNIGTGLITASGNIQGANLVTGGAVSATGNVTAGNVSTGLVALSTGLSSSRTDVSVSTNTVIDSFNPANYRTAKYVISATGDDGYQSVETLLVHDGSSAYITIYGSVCSNVSADIIDVTANVNGVSGNVTVYATAGGANVKVNLVSSYIQV